MGHVLSMVQNSKKIDILKLFTLQWGIWFLSHSYILYTLAHKVFVVKNLGQKKLFKHSLWILELLFLMKQSLEFFFKDLVEIF
jgi:hypothetical protein